MLGIFNLYVYDKKSNLYIKLQHIEEDTYLFCTDVAFDNVLCMFI